MANDKADSVKRRFIHISYTHQHEGQPFPHGSGGGDICTGSVASIAGQNEIILDFGHLNLNFFNPKIYFGIGRDSVIFFH